MFVFFSISKTQLVTYIFPLYPAAALFVGVLLDKAASGDMDSGKAVAKSLIAGLIYSALLAAALVVMARSKYPEAGIAAAAMAATLLLAAVIAFAMRGKPDRSAWTIGTGMAVFALILMFCVVPRLALTTSTRDIVRTIPRVADGRVAEWNLRKPSLLFYLGSTPEHLPSVSEARRQLGEEVSTWVVCKDKDASPASCSGECRDRPNGWADGYRKQIGRQSERTGAQLINSLSIVYPMYNEKDNIPIAISEAIRVGYKIAPKIEVIVVDDASTDGCGAIADTLAERHPEVHVIHHKRNRKLGGSLQTGFNAATMEWVLYMDSDLPIKMDDALNAVPLTDEADVVIGWRKSRAESWRREFISKVYNWMIRTMFDLHVTDVNFAFKLFRREFLDQIILTSEGSFIDAELLLEMQRGGCADH